MAIDYKLLTKNVSKLRKRLKDFPKHAAPKEVHSLRTRTRQVEAELEAMQLSSRKNERRLLRHLREIRKEAGKVRDMDVFTVYLLKIEVDDEADCDCHVQVFEYLGAERYRAARKLNRVVTRHRDESRKCLKRTLKRLVRFKPSSRNADARSYNQAESSLAASAIELSSELAEPPTLNRKNLHSYRQKVKELRDVLRTGENRENQALADALAQSKDAIGEWHDWEELLSIMTKLFKHSQDCGVVKNLRTISRRKYEAALSTTNKMRRQYIADAKSGKQRSSDASKQRPRPLLEAVAAIAS